MDDVYLIYPHGKPGENDGDPQPISAGTLEEALTIVRASRHRDRLESQSSGSPEDIEHPVKPYDIRYPDGQWHNWEGPIYKIYILVSREAVKKANGVRGKLMAQAGHASLHSFWDAIDRFPEDAKAYRASMHAYKITLAVDTDEDLKRFHDAYRPVCGVSLVVDAGFTVFKVPTMTCLGIGPISADKIGPDLSALKLFS